MRRVLAQECFRCLDRLFGATILVIGVAKLQLHLRGEFAEREARLQLLEYRYRFAIVADVYSVLSLLIGLRDARIEVEFLVIATATRGHERNQQQYWHGTLRAYRHHCVVEQFAE